MRKTFTLSMAWLHTWCGLVIGWALFAVLLSGSIAVFNSEITYWLTPEVRGGLRPDRAQALEIGAGYLEAHAPGSRMWRIILPTSRDPVVTVSWRTDKGRTEARRLDPETGRSVGRDTEGGAFFLKLHEDLHIDRDRNPTGLYIVCFLGVAMLAACVSGIVVHKRIFKDLFLFRPKSSPHRAWLDAHNVLAVLALPFHMVMAYTGLVLLYWLFVPAAVATLYHGDNAAFRTVAITQEYKTVSGGPGPPAPMIPLAQAMADAERRFGPGRMAYLYVRDPNRSNAVIEAYRMRDDQVSQQVDQVAYDGTSGRMIRALDSGSRSLPFRVQSFVAALHWIEWGGAVARWGYFLAGLMSSGMVAAGLVVFVEKRRRELGARPWLRAVERLNVAAVAGLCVACVAFLWAERLTPAGAAGRAAIPVAAFFAVWLATVLHAALRPARRGWIEQFALTALLCLGAPALGGLVLDHLAARDWVRAAADLTLIGLAVLFGWGAWRLARPARRPVRAAAAAEAR